MRILFVTYGLPYPPHSGTRIRDFNLIRNMARHHSILLLSLLERADEMKHVPEMEKYCESVDVVFMNHRSVPENIYGVLRCLKAGQPIATYPFYYADLEDRIVEVMAKDDINIVQIEHSFLAPYIKAIPRNSKCKTILSFHNIGVKQYKSMYALKTGGMQKYIFLLKWLLMRHWESRYAGRFDHCLVVSDEEGRFLKSLNSRVPVTVIDNGVDTNHFRPLVESSNGKTLLFTGTMGYPPNIDAVLYFCSSIMPLIERRVTDVQLIIAGRYPTEEIRRLGKLKNVIVADNVPDITSYYERSQVSIVPLRAGGGSRLKILESMALGRPVVSTTKGAEGLNVTDGEHILIADTPAAFAERIIRLFHDNNLREKISFLARQLVEARYDWSAISRKLMRLYERVSAT